MNKSSAIVVGAGIVGLAIARALAIRKYEVTVVERTTRAAGASIRNFGMIWPIGQPDGELYERAMLSRQIWKEIADEAGIWYEEKGSLHLAYREDEFDVLKELSEIYSRRGYRMLSPDEVAMKSPAAVANNLLGGLYSHQEMVVDPKKAIDQLAGWLQAKHNVRFVRGAVVTAVNHPRVYAGADVFEADEIYVCSGADLETLFPDIFKQLPVTKCKLQMMRLAEQPMGWRIGPSLCGALSLLHYASFRSAASLPGLEKRLRAGFPDHIKWGIHVMVSQNQDGEVTIGDSHEYGDTHDPFDKYAINNLILDYLSRFARFKNPVIKETWNGIYAKMTDGFSHTVLHPEPGVTIINGLGGAGMTLSFGLCEQLVQKAHC